MNPYNPEVTIRRINGDDKAQWLALWQGYLDFYRADVAPQVTDRTFERLGQDEQVYGLVAQDADGQLLGLMNLVFHPSTWSAVGYCYIEDLYVSPQAAATRCRKSCSNRRIAWQRRAAAIGSTG